VIVGAYVHPSLIRIVIAGSRLMRRYYILRDEMLADLTRLAHEQVQANAPWQVRCIRFLIQS
jgi:hypothetical protein